MSHRQSTTASTNWSQSTITPCITTGHGSKYLTAYCTTTSDVATCKSITSSFCQSPTARRFTVAGLELAAYSRPRSDAELRWLDNCTGNTFLCTETGGALQALLNCPTGCFKKSSAPPKKNFLEYCHFGWLSLYVWNLANLFATHIRISTNFCRFISIFHHMALIFPRVPVIFSIFWNTLYINFTTSWAMSLCSRST